MYSFPISGKYIKTYLYEASTCLKQADFECPLNACLIQVGLYTLSAASQAFQQEMTLYPIDVPEVQMQNSCKNFRPEAWEMSKIYAFKMCVLSYIYMYIYAKYKKTH